MATLNSQNLSQTTCASCNHEYTGGHGYISGWDDDRKWKSQCPACGHTNTTELVISRREGTVFGGAINGAPLPKAQAKGSEMMRSKLTKWDSVSADFSKQVNETNRKHMDYVQEQRLKQANKFNITPEALDAYLNDWDTVCCYRSIGNLISYIEAKGTSDLSQSILDYIEAKNGTIKNK